MKTLVLLFHPDFSHSKVNQEMYQAIQNVPGVMVRKMYQLYPNFKIDVTQEHQLLERADRVIWQFPIRWYSAPALLKEWEDEVLTPGWAYQRKYALNNKELTVAATFGAGGYQHNSYSRYTPYELLRPFQATAYRVKMKFMRPFVITGVKQMDSAQIYDQGCQYRNFVNGHLDELGELE